MDTLTADQSEDPTFIHSRVDDLGLTVYEFRVYCHLKRRSNHGVAWPGIASIARVCRMHKMTAVKAIKGLEERKMVTVTRVEGEGNRYRLTKPSAWREEAKVDNGTSIKGITVEYKIDNGTSAVLDNGRISTEGYPKEENPIEDTPIPPAPLSAPRRRFAPVRVPSEEFLSFWDEYPRKEAMKPAWIAWQKIKQPAPVSEILEALQLQKRKLWKYCEKRHIPLASTWINAERWDDEL
ncbi:MAG TPA: helix-turn-helix domain-containing protein [Candidatus Udaeobacter sp.]|nr:helix-turn-helix domain-containing protein [Candidatus Udaeobacter sp.]